MPTIDEITSLEEIDAAMSKLRERRRALKQSGKAVQRKIATLARRRERWMDRIREIDAQIIALRQDMGTEVVAPKRRGRRPKSALAIS